MSILLISVVAAGPSAAAEAAGTFEDSVLAWGLEAPTAMVFAPDGRLFVAERSGDVRIIKDGVLLEQPFLSLPVDYVCCERGLLGITLDPDFSANGIVYVYYTTAGEPIHSRVSRFAADPANPDVALAGSEVPILDLEPLAPNFHNGGAIHFGGDGKLYIAVGDNLVSENSQWLGTRLGKMLRINPDGTIPEDNPFYYVEGAKKEVWALGLRNPYSFAFSQDNGRMYINDVGRDLWEEVNMGSPGANYGWPWCEGPCSTPGLADPVHAYPHDGEFGMAVTGGAFYDGEWATQFPEEYRGSYFFGDYVAGFIKRLPADGRGGNLPGAVDFLQNAPTPLDIDVGPDGSLYYLSYSHGSVHRVQYVAPEVNGTPQAVLTTATAPAFGELPLAVAFDASQSSDPDGDTLSYSWDFGDGSGVQEGGATATHTYESEGRYSAKVVVSDGRGGTATGEVEVVAGDSPPAARIESPAPGATYSGGDTIFFSGTGYDGKDGELPDSVFHWEVLLHHNTHTHPFLQFDGVRSGNFTVPKIMETDHDVWFGVYLTVVDSAGLAGTSAADVRPNKVTVTVDSSVPGTAVSLAGGQPRATPFSFTGVAGVTRTLQAPDEVQWSAEGGDGSIKKRYAFRSWSDGVAAGSPTRALDTPATNTTIVANYAFVPARLTIESADMDGNPVPGMWASVALADGGIPLQAGLTPHAVLEADPDAQYAVTVQDYGGLVFDHWEDGSTDRTRTVSNLVSDATLTAYYDTRSTLRGFTSLTHAGAAPEEGQQPDLTVNAALTDGGGPLGMWVIIDAHLGGVSGSATYTVYASDYPGLVFDHWEDDGSADMVRTLTIGEDTTLTAYYVSK